MNPLPLPLRLAAGLVATAIEQVRELPRTVIELPVTAVSQTLQASMRFQQRITELAIKGDRALGTLRPIEEKPSWATFDEDETPRRNGASTVTELRPRPETPADVAARTTAARSATPIPVLTQPEPEPMTPPAAAVAARTTAEAAAPSPIPLVEMPAGDPGPNVLPGYAELTIPQLRGKLRFLSLDDLRALLDYESVHGDRAPYLTMLTNRISTVLAE